MSPTSQSVHVVTYETRDPIGRIVQNIDRIYAHESEAIKRVRYIDEHTSMFPNMVADLEEYRLSDGVVNVPIVRYTRLGHSHAENMTVADVLMIRERWGQGEAVRNLASTYGVANQTIYDIVTGKTWQSI